MNIQLVIKRTQNWENFQVEVSEEAFVLDALEAAYLQDPTLMFRHSCHHASCGSCGMVMNGIERLACVTKVAEVGGKKRQLRLEPLRNFQIIADLIVDQATLLCKIEECHETLIRSDETGIRFNPVYQENSLIFTRLENCIECGLCVSACPVAGTSADYLGPAVLAAAWRVCEKGLSDNILTHVNTENGVWRCHSAFECSEVCPSKVEPGMGIMALRRKVILGR